MRKVGSALALSCAIALSGHGAEAQDQPPKQTCLTVLSAAAGAYLDYAIYDRVERKQGSAIPHQDKIVEGAYGAIGIVVQRSRCSERLWQELRACYEDRLKVGDVSTPEWRNAAVVHCQRTVLGPYMR
ncbi:hypothetical protein [Inquilinus sp. OTU3971]|uniref:hypothetical protein n=1 Tax=Inquilinus sp. OTU3971 TaxID=3043855 RepID=UPI00313BEC54